MPIGRVFVVAERHLPERVGAGVVDLHVAVAVPADDQDLVAPAEALVSESEGRRVPALEWIGTLPGGRFTPSAAPTG